MSNNDSPVRNSASPLRPHKQSSSSKQQQHSVNLNNSRLEDELNAMNQETLEEQVKALIQDNYDLKMQGAADADHIEGLTRDIESLRKPYQLNDQ